MENAGDNANHGSQTNFPSPLQSSSSSSSSASSIRKPPTSSMKARVRSRMEAVLKSFSWIPQNWKWSKIKPVIRCALAAWISVLLFVIPEVSRFIGQASFLLLVSAFLSPPSDPFLSVLEREALILLFVAGSWGWICLALFLSNLARSVQHPTVSLFDAISGEYIEPAPTVIIAVFIFLGTSFVLYIKARQGPGPYLFASIFSCISIDISLTTAVLLPYPYYIIGRTIILPLALHAAVALLCSIFIFPCTISALYTTRLSDVIDPIIVALDIQGTILDNPFGRPSDESTNIDGTATATASPRSSTSSLSLPASSTFADNLSSLRTETKKAEGALVPLAAAVRLLKSDLIYSRFSPSDFKNFQGHCRRLTGRADGLAVYFGLIDPNRERLVPSKGGTLGKGSTVGDYTVTPMQTVPPTPTFAMSRAVSRDASPERDGVALGQSYSNSNSIQMLPRTRHSPGISPSQSQQSHLQNPHQHSHQHHHHHQHHHSLLHSSLMSVAKARAKQEERAVGLFESQRYLHLEATKMSDPNEVEWTTEFVELLKTSCSPVIHSTQSGLKAVSEWLANVRMGRLHHIRDAAILSILPTKSRPAIRARARIETRRSAWNGTIDKLKQLRNDLEKNLREFKETTRFLVLDPYRGIIDSETTHSQPATPTPRSPHTPTVASPLAEGFEHEHHHRADSHDMRRAPPHRHLFNCYVYQYNLIRTAEIAIEMLDEILRLEESEDRPWPHCRLWTPVEGFTWKRGLVSEPNERADDDDDPNIIQGLQHTSPYESNESSRTKLDLSSDPNKDRKEKSTVNVEEAIQPSSDSTRSHNLHRDDSPTTPTQPQLPPGFVTGDLGLPKSRDPDALPPRNVIEWILGLLYHFVLGLGGGNSVFAIKAGILTIVLCLPSFIKASAEFAYKNRFIWGIFIGQLTIARFRGDTAFGWISRVFATFGGGITGMVVWYISAGSGRGSPIGLAATCAVAFPFFFYARLYWNIAPITNIIFFVTSALVVGYSYQDMVISLPGNPGVGWEVSWRRFVLVSAGVTAAFIASFLPPSMTIRRYEREVLATTSCELGSLYCAILSFANTKQEEDIQEIIASLVAVRNKLNKALALRANVGLEFSLRGRWPADRYKRIADLQIAISYSLSHLMSVLKHLESPWARAFLRRTRFIDPNFQGDILAVVSMITYALRTGSPLPQITPCPLLDRFMLQNHGLNVIHKEAEEDYGLPRSITLETVKNEQYMMFCVGISTAYGVICRLDRLMVAVKEVVGEHYHIHGVGIAKSLNRESIQVVGGIDLSARVAVPRFGDEERGRRTM